MNARVLVTAFALTLPVAASAATVTWEVAAVAEFAGARHLGQGVKAYVPETDIVVKEVLGQDGRTFWEKSLWLNDSLALEAAVYREPRLDGFGLLVHRAGDPRGFSWEWFDRGEGDTFLKRQGEGRLAVRVKRGSGCEELESVEFLEDVVLRYFEDMTDRPHSHEVTIRKGSVLRITPAAVGEDTSW